VSVVLASCALTTSMRGAAMTMTAPNTGPASKAVIQRDLVN
jgi:hypothetical protein